MNNVLYLNNTVLCKISPSNIHGVGVFALRDIEKGVTLTDYTFLDAHNFNFPKTFKLTYTEFEALYPEIRELILDKVTFSKTASLKYYSFISPNRHAVVQLFMNHSDNPNSDGKRALRNIKKDEEITENFNNLTKEMSLANKKHFYFL